jgi:hypothetical protein
MQQTSALYHSILSGENHWFETQLVIERAGTFGETDLFSISTSHQMFHGSPAIGSAVAGEIQIKMVYPQSAFIPTMAKLMPQVRVCNATQHSEWLAQGVYFVDTRERTVTDTGESILELHGYDAMLKAEQPFQSNNITGDSTDVQMVNEIASIIGVEVDERTYDIMTAAYTIPLPVGYSCREVLGYIASMYVGAFIITDDGKLRLVSILELPPETNYLIDGVGDAIIFGGDRILV